MKSPVLERYSLLQELLRRGVRITGQRKILIEIIQDSEHHLDAATLLQRARERHPGVNRATVYRTLELLKSLRLIDELDLMQLNGGKHFYEAKTNVDHIHLACFNCGKVEEISSPLFERLEEEIARQSGFRIQVARLEVGGRCRECCAQVQANTKCMEANCCKDPVPRS